MTSRADHRRASALLALLTAGTLLLAGCGSSGGSDAATDTTSASKTELEGLTRDDPLQVGRLSLPEVAEDGTETPFAFTAEPGQLLFVAFGYTNCPDVCPTTLYDIKKAKAALGDDGDRIDVAFATVDPDRDTPEVMTAYLGSFVDDGHPLRSTDPTEFAAAEEAFGVTSAVEEQPDGEIKVAHTARSFVVDDTGAVVLEWSFGTGPEAMASDLSILLGRMAEGS